MAKQSVIFSLLLMLGVGSFAVGQSGTMDDEAKEKAAKKAEAKKMIMDLTQTVIVGKFKEAEMTPEQTQKITKLIADNIEGLAFPANKMKEFFSADEKTKFDKAKKQAERAKYTEEEAITFALKKLKLPEERVKEYHKLSSGTNTVGQKVYDEIAKILTPEQLEKIPTIKRTLRLEPPAKPGAKSGVKQVMSKPAGKAGSATKPAAGSAKK